MKLKTKTKKPQLIKHWHTLHKFHYMISQKLKKTDAIMIVDTVFTDLRHKQCTWVSDIKEVFQTSNKCSLYTTISMCTPSGPCITNLAMQYSALKIISNIKNYGVETRKMCIHINMQTKASHPS